MTTQEQNKPTAPEEPGDLSPAEENKRKFQEALARKQDKAQAKNNGGEGGGSAKVGSAHGPVKNQRNFRRKSGG
jgi:hypothetical protein